MPRTAIVRGTDTSVTRTAILQSLHKYNSNYLSGLKGAQTVSTTCPLSRNLLYCPFKTATNDLNLKHIM